eukprot:1089213_1
MEDSDNKPILMLPNIETPFHEEKDKESCTSEPLRKKRKISLRVPKCKMGDSMECLYSNDDKEEEEEAWRLCSIVAIKSSKFKGFLYYVHYTDYNRRLDQWVTGNKLRKPTGKIKKPSQLLLENTSNKRLTRGQKRRVFEQHHIDIDEFENEMGGDIDYNANNEDELYEKIHLKTNKIKNIEKIQFGKSIIDCWYFSPYPEEYIGSTRLLYICEYCLKYMKFYNTYHHHINNECFIRHPPGNEIYRHNGISVWEIDGCIDKIYCQNLCLLAKLFFDHKTLYFDVSPFLFYIICEYDEHNPNVDGFHLVGYFSKERNSPEGYNLACILTMPHKQKLGFGRFIISLSYELSKKEEKIGSPEKPLSDLGKISYKSYWIENILTVIESYMYYGEITIQQISQMTSFTKQDIINCLKDVNMLNCYKGQHVIKYRPQNIKKYLNQFKKRQKMRKNIFYPEHLHWNTLKINSKKHPWNGLSSFHK